MELFIDAAEGVPGGFFDENFGKISEGSVEKKSERGTAGTSTSGLDEFYGKTIEDICEGTPGEIFQHIKEYSQGLQEDLLEEFPEELPQEFSKKLLKQFSMDFCRPSAEHML